MTREEIAVAFRRCGTPSACGKQCPYYTKGLHCYQALREDVIRILEGNDTELERIHQNIRAYINSGCSTDTEADKEYVCSQIDRIFEGKPVLLDEEVEQND